MWSPERWLPAWCRRQMRFLLHVLAHAVKIWRTTSSVWSSWRPLPTVSPGVEKSFAIQAGREVRVMVKPEEVSEDQMVLLARDLASRSRRGNGVPRSDQGQRSA